MPSRPDLWSRAADRWFLANTPLREVPCPTCGYDLRRLAAPGGVLRCPECGTSGPRYRMLRRPRISSLPAVTIAAVITGALTVAWLIWGSTVAGILAAGGLVAWLATVRIDHWRRGLRSAPPGHLGRPPARSGVDRALTDTLTERGGPPGLP